MNIKKKDKRNQNVTMLGLESKMYSVRLPLSLIQQIKLLSKKTYKLSSTIVREAISDYIYNIEENETL